MLQIYPNTQSISQPYKGLLLDAYGTFWGGNAVGLFPHAKETMQKLVALGKTIGILSNTTQLSSKEIEKFNAHGLIEGQHFHFLVTSGDVAQRIFQQGELPFPGKQFWTLFGGLAKYSNYKALFEGSPYVETPKLKDADFIYISIPHIDGNDQTDPKLFRKIVQELLSTGLPMVCANPDRFAHEGNPPRPVVRQGSIAALYEEMGGKVFYIGKPDKKVYRVAVDSFVGIKPAEILMVGDNPETDIRGARAFGISSALITQTGIMADRIAHDEIEKVIATLPRSDYPDYFIVKI